MILKVPADRSSFFGFRDVLGLNSKTLKGRHSSVTKGDALTISP